MSKSREKIISPIALKYYKPPEKNDIFAPVFKCAWCFESSNRAGGGFYNKEGRPHQICEGCAVRRYKDDYNFKTLAGARARRRRIFDVGYLFNEMVLDLYMKEKRIINFEHCKNSDEIFVKASQLFNHLFSKDDKILLEETESQKDIENEIIRRLQSMQLKPIFDSWL